MPVAVYHGHNDRACYCVTILRLTNTFATEARAISLDQGIATNSIIEFYLVWRSETFDGGTFPGSFGHY